MHPSRRYRSFALLVALSTQIACTGFQSSEVLHDDATVDGAADTASALSASPRDPNSHTRAEFAVSVLWSRYFGSPAWTADWAFSQAFEVVNDSVRRTGGRAHLDMLRTLYAQYRQITYSAQTPTRYADHALMGLALLRASVQMSGTRKLVSLAPDALTDARAQYALVQAGEDTAGGGVFATADKTLTTSIASGAASRLACELYLEAGAPADLAFAKRVYLGWRARGALSSTGSVQSSIDTGGVISTDAYTLDYGMLIGASLCLHQATGEAQYRDDAVLMGNTLLKNMVSTQNNVAFLIEPKFALGQVTGDAALYKGITVRYLTELSQHAPEWSGLEALLEGSATTLVTVGADSNQFASAWGAAPVSGDGLNAQISGALALASLATTATGRLQDRTPGFFYEAEQQIFTSSIINESLYAGYTGTGYLAGWSSDTQQSTFQIETPYNASHRLVFRYASIFAASRIVATNTTATLAAFTPTGHWEQYAFLPLNFSLSAGRNDIAVSVSSQQSATGLLNLDNMTAYPLTSASVATDAVPLAVPNIIEPVDSVGQCAGAQFVWDAVSGAQRYDLIVDDQIMWSGSATTTTLSPSSLTTAPHVWSVVAFNDSIGTPSAQGSFNFTARAVAAPTSIALNDTSDGLLISWTDPAPGADATAFVSISGTLRCSMLRRTSCIVPNIKAASLSANAVEVRLVNVCEQASHTAP